MHSASLRHKPPCISFTDPDHPRIALLPSPIPLILIILALPLRLLPSAIVVLTILTLN